MIKKRQFELETVTSRLHNTQLSHTTVVDKAHDYCKRLFLEAWCSQRDQNAGNKHI